MKRATSWFKFYPSDFLDGTRSLSSQEVGDYIRLLAFIYDQGGKVPNDAHLLRHLLRCSKAPDAAKRIQRLIDIHKLSTDADGNLRNGRADREIEKFYLDNLPFQTPSYYPSNGGSNYPSGTPKKSTNSTRARAQTRNQKPTSPNGDVRRAHARAPPQDFSQYLMNELRQMQQQEENGHDQQHPIDGTFRRLEAGNGYAEDAGSDPTGQTADAKPH